MQTKPHSLTNVSAALALALIAPAGAIEAPADDAPPPPAAEAPIEHEAPAAEAGQQEPEAKQPKPEAKAAIAYLGVVSAQVPAMLAEHLGLKPGEGVLVQAVMPESPAAKAGVAVHDVITSVGKEAVGTSMDLTREVGARKPGETIHLNVIHKGKTAELDVTLGTRPNEMARINPKALEQLNLDGVPDELADRVRGMIEGNLGGIDMQFGGDAGLAAPPQMEDAMREMKKRMEDAMQGLKLPEPGNGPDINVQQNAAIRLLDEQGSIELKSNNGGKEVTIRDKDNKITWTGPWDTEQDKAAAPEDVRKRVERMNIDQNFQGNGLRLQLRGGIHDPIDPE